MKSIQVIDKKEAARRVFQGNIVSEHESSLARLMDSIYHAPMQQELAAMRSQSLIAQEKQFQKKAQQLGLQLPHIAYMPTFPGVQVIEGDGTDWVLMNLLEDPLYQAAGNRLIAPKQVRRTINTVKGAGFPPAALFIGHEVPQNVNIKDPEMLLRNIAPPLTRNQERRLSMLNQGIGAFWTGVGAISLAAAAGAGLMAGAVAGTAGALTIGMAAGLDPVLFLLLIDPETQSKGEYLASWYYLAHWTWDE